MMRIALERTPYDNIATIAIYDKGILISSCRLNKDDDAHRIFDVTYNLFARACLSL